MKTINISEKEYQKLKRKEKIADSVMLRLKATLDDVENGRMRRVA